MVAELLGAIQTTAIHTLRNGFKVGQNVAFHFERKINPFSRASERTG